MPSPQSSTLYEQVAGKIEQLIRSGALRPGDRVPSVRRACIQHGVSLTTAVQAYLSLENRGLIEARPKSGFFVRSQVRDRLLEPAVSRVVSSPKRVGVGNLQARIFDAARLPEVIPFGAAYPGAANLPVKKLSLIMASVARSAGAQGINYDMPPGSERLRRQIARRSLDWGGNLSPDEIITTCGGTEALGLCLRAVTKAGDIVAVESPAYFGMLQQIEALGLKALEIPMHPRTGMNLDALERALKNRRIAACLAVPNFSNPLGSLMPEENKQRLLELLARRDVPLIEDDINGDLSHAGVRPRVVHSYDKAGRVLLCGSFSKTLAPGYRVGWVAPGRFYEQVKSLKLTSTLATSSLPQLAIAEFMANGGYDHHLRSLRHNFATQIKQMSDAVAEAFPAEIKITRPEGGFVLWIELPKKVSSLKLHELALNEKISIAPGPMFSATQNFQNFIRLNCGHPWSAGFERAIDTLGRLVKKLM
ncbi:MAG TPA: PLP-dependent aminotransferase family protein [Verrucomicrobiae bacterium]|nr:PLP-dependent aminotransferase family protein [Verrucomicrobiae bacterium]